MQKKGREKGLAPSEIAKLLQQAEKHQEALIAVHDHIKSLMEDHSAHLSNLKKMVNAAS